MPTHSEDVQCQMKTALIEEIRDTMNRIADFDTQVLWSLTEEPDAIDRFNDEVRRLRQEKDALIEEYKIHVRRHGCCGTALPSEGPRR